MTLHTIYKYLPKQYAQSLTCDGNIKIGTLYDYRNTEEYGREIGDENEGISIEYSHDKEAKRGDNLNPLESTAFQVGPGMTLIGNYIERKHVSPNLYLYCASSIYDIAILNRLNEDFPENNYDACVKISNLKDVVEEISRALSGKALFAGCIPCSYRNRKFHYSESESHPATIKDPEYSYQEEIRLIWEPKSGNIDVRPVYLTIKSISKNCSLC